MVAYVLSLQLNQTISQSVSQSIRVFTARCYAECGYEIVCRLSVCPSVCNV